MDQGCPENIGMFHRHNVSLVGTMGDTRRSQTISTESQGIAKQVTLSAGQQSYAPNGVSLVWLATGGQPLAIEEPYEGNLHVRVCGEGVPIKRDAFTRKRTAIRLRSIAAGELGRSAFKYKSITKEKFGYGEKKDPEKLTGC